MALSKYSGIQQNMPQSFSTMLDNFFNESVNSRTVTGFTPHVDACETENGYEIEVALPGLKEEDVHVNFQEGRLTITGERKFERKEDSKRYHMVETQYGSFSRTFYLPDNVNADNITANLSNGMLLVTVPKDEQKTMKREIKIGSGSEAKSQKKQEKISVSADNGKTAKS